MNSRHIADIYFGGRRESAKKGIQKLKAMKLVRARARHPTEIETLHLTLPAIRMLRERGDLQEYPSLSLSDLSRRTQVSDFTIRHELAVLDVKSSFVSAVRREAHVSISEFTTWPRLNEFEALGKVVKPDGFLRLNMRDKVEHAFYLEVDRSTESFEVLLSRAKAYYEHYRSGGYAAECGAPRSAFKEFPFRVLIVFLSEERRNNFAARILAENVPILTLLWLTTADEAQKSPLGKIWARPLDYREALRGSRFELHGALLRIGKRCAARNAFIQEGLAKQPLISSAS